MGWLLHQYIPREKDFSELTNKMLTEIEWELAKCPVSHSLTGHRWSIVIYCLTLTPKDVSLPNIVYLYCGVFSIYITLI